METKKRVKIELTASDLARIKTNGNSYFLNKAKPQSLEGSEFFVYCYMLAFNDFLTDNEMEFKTERSFQEPIE